MESCPVTHKVEKHWSSWYQERAAGAGPHLAMTCSFQCLPLSLPPVHIWGDKVGPYDWVCSPRVMHAGDWSHLPPWPLLQPWEHGRSHGVSWAEKHCSIHVSAYPSTSVCSVQSVRPGSVGMLVVLEAAAVPRAQGTSLQNAAAGTVSWIGGGECFTPHIQALWCSTPLGMTWHPSWESVS